MPEVAPAWPEVAPTWPEGQPCRPKFMVIGAPKSGTTSLFDYLTQHPEVQAPAKKELCYFSNFKRHMQRFRVQPSNSWALYVAAFSGRITLSTQRAFLQRQRQHASGGMRDSAGRPAFQFTRAGGPKSTSRCEAVGKASFEACPFYLGEAHTPRAIRHVFPHLKAIAVLRNPRERTTSAFNDYVRVGRISRANATTHAMERLVLDRVDRVQSGRLGMEAFEARILTSGIYIHGLRRWSHDWPAAQLLVLQAEELFSDTDATMAHIGSYLGLKRPFPAAALRQVHNRNPIRKARPSRLVNETLDAFFSPYNEELYVWAAEHKRPFPRWASASRQTGR